MKCCTGLSLWLISVFYGIKTWFRYASVLQMYRSVPGTKHPWVLKHNSRFGPHWRLPGIKIPYVCIEAATVTSWNAVHGRGSGRLPGTLPYLINEETIDWYFLIFILLSIYLCICVYNCKYLAGHGNIQYGSNCRILLIREYNWKHVNFTVHPCPRGFFLQGIPPGCS
jgi:hypothetical protein